MSGSKIGSLKRVAAQHDISVEELLERLETSSYCYECEQWKSREAFGVDTSRSNGVARKCTDCRRVKVRAVRKGAPSPHKGRKHTKQARRNMSAGRKGKPSSRKGAKLTPDQRKWISVRTRETTPRGANHPRWKGGGSEAQRIRHSAEYADWRNAVFERDNYTCQKCGIHNRQSVQAHHVKPFAQYPELRLDINNGITLCEGCHLEAHGRWIDEETIYLIEIAYKHAFDHFGSINTIAKAFNLRHGTITKIINREGRYKLDE